MTLRALGAPRRYIFAVAWGFAASLVFAGTALGLAGGYALSLGVSAWLARETGIALAPSLGAAEATIAALVCAIGLGLAILPAWAMGRRPLAEALIDH